MLRAGDGRSRTHRPAVHRGWSIQANACRQHTAPEPAGQGAAGTYRGARGERAGAMPARKWDRDIAPIPCTPEGIPAQERARRILARAAFGPWPTLVGG